MKNLKHPLFVIFSVLFLLNQWIEKSGIIIPVVHSYLDDFLCLPVTLSIALFLQQTITFSPDYVFSKRKILFVWVFYSLFFELWLPQYNFRYTSDVLDVVAYGTGGIVFYLFLNNPAIKNKGIFKNIPS